MLLKATSAGREEVPVQGREVNLLGQEERDAVSLRHYLNSSGVEF